MDAAKAGVVWQYNCSCMVQMKPVPAAILLQVLLAMASTPILAQFQPRTMTTNLTGTELIFSTEWTLKGEDYNPNSKLIHYRSGQFRTLRSEQSQRDPATGCLSNRPVFTRPEMSLDGTLYSYVMELPSGETCTTSTAPPAEVRSDNGDLVISSNEVVHLSANGRWAYLESGGSHALVNLETGSREDLPTIPLFGVGRNGRLVANDGTLVNAYRSSSVYLKRPGLEGEFIPAPAYFDSATMSDSGNYAILQTRTSKFGPRPVLWLLDLSSKEFFPVAVAEEGCYAPSLSTDGWRMVFLSRANWEGRNNSFSLQAYLMDMRTGSLTQLSEGINGVEEALITGDGRGVYVRDSSGAISFHDLETRQIQEVVPPTPAVVSFWMPSPLVPGSRYFLRVPGSGGVSLSADGMQIRVLSADSWGVDYIVPEGLSSGSLELELSLNGSPFQPLKIPFLVRDFAPRFQYWNTTPRIWHDTGGTAVFEGSPARSGEVIEVLLSGLGPVDSSGNTLFAIQWTFNQAGELAPVEVLASRKSPYPEEEGFYRVKLRLPQIAPDGIAGLLCQDARDGGNGSGVILAVTP